jgi:hypothetical protein
LKPKAEADGTEAAQLRRRKEKTRTGVRIDAKKTKKVCEINGRCTHHIGYPGA